MDAEEINSCFSTVDKYDYEDADAFYQMLYETSNAPADTLEENDEDPEILGNWSVVKDYDFEISINAVDEICLQQAKIEVPIVLNQILKHVYPLTDDGEDRLSHANQVQHIDMFHVWTGTGSPFAGVFSPFLLSMKRWIEAAIAEEIKLAEIFLFVEAEYMMCFYKCSPTMYFNKEVGDRFSCSIDGISEKRYRQFLQALSSSKQFKVAHPTFDWIAPFNCNDKMTEIYDQFVKHCADIGFAKEVSVVALDDDHMRLRSREVTRCGYTQMNNPAKGQGVVQHAMVGGATGLFLGGRVTASGETTSDAVSLMQMLLAKVHVARLIILHAILFFWDRGYGGVEGKVHNTTIANGSDVHTTCQRQRSFPFTYSQIAGATRSLIQEFGAPVCYWASKQIKTVAGYKTQYAMAHRNGLKRVVLMSTTLEVAGPGKYCFVTKKPYCEDDSNDEVDMVKMDRKENETDDNESDGDSVENPVTDKCGGVDNDSDVESVENPVTDKFDGIFRAFEQTHITRLTSAQRCPEWFLLRQFRITGTCAYNVWNCATNANDDVRAIKKAIGFRLKEDDESDASDEEDAKKKTRKEKAKAAKATDPPEFKLTIPQLKELLKGLGRSVTGLDRKRQLVLAYIAAKEEDEMLNSLLKKNDPEYDGNEDVDDKEEDNDDSSSKVLLLELMKCWFMPPWKGNTATKIGKENEKNIAEHFALFMSHESEICITKMRDYGLIANKDNLSLAFSPDGIVTFILPRCQYIQMAVLEMKTHVSRSELEEEYFLENEYGRYVYVDPEKDPDKFKCLIRFKKYRAQVLHGLVCSELHHAFYIVACSTYIIRVVHVNVHRQFIASYNEEMVLICKRANLDWMRNGPVPEFTIDDFKSSKLKYAVDMHTIRSTWKLWKELERKILNQGKPMPEGKFLLPMSIALWNRCKGPIDVYSRYLSNVAPRHAQLSVLGALWLRMLMTIAFNAYHGYTMCHGYKFLKGECKTYRQYQDFKKKIHSFAEFISTLCHQIRFYCSNVLGIDGIILHRSGEAALIEPLPTQLLLAQTVDSSGRNTVDVRPERFYNKRNTFFTDPLLVQKRTTNLKQHLDSRVSCFEATGHVQQRCVWCCENHTVDKKGCKVRMGYKASNMCGICSVPLCVKPRYNNLPCYVLFHRAKVLMNPCKNRERTGLVAPDRARVKLKKSLGILMDTPDDLDICVEITNTSNQSRRVSFDNCSTPISSEQKRHRECIGVTPGGLSSSKRLKK